jgi:hypothetical protein
MPDNDAEFMAAYSAFLRSWMGEAFFAQGHSEKDFADAVDQLINQGSPIEQILRAFHAKHGRYPTFTAYFKSGMS